MTNAPLPPVLEDYRRQIETLKARALALSARLTAGQMRERPLPEAWSPVEILDHLRRTVEQYLPAIDASLARAEKTASPPGEPNYGWVWRLFLRTLEPPIKHRFRAPKAFAPGENPAVDSTLAGFLAAHDALIERIHRAADYDLERVKVTSPANALLKPPLGCALLILAAHGRRHFTQLPPLPGAELPGERG
jgi:hypothetical protein